MSTINIKKTFRRKYKKLNRKKRIIHQSIRLKIDKGTAVTFPNQDTGTSIFDIGNTQVYEAEEVLNDSPLLNFTNYWGYYQLYGVAIEATPTKQVVNHYPSTYIGFVYNAQNAVPSIDQARMLENAFCLPSFGASTVRKFWYVNTPWVARSDPPIGFFWTQSNAVSSANQGPRWEVKLTLYLRFKLLQV